MSIWLLTILMVYFIDVMPSTFSVRAPELFGDGTMVVLYADDQYVGYINAWGDWIIYGEDENCKIVQVSGEPIDGVNGQPIDCKTDGFSDGKFRGWIDFRGHTRPFCGAKTVEDIPTKCKLKGDDDG